METYFSSYCTSYADTLNDAPSTGTCSRPDVIDRVAIPLLTDILSAIRAVAFVGLVVACLFVYVVIVILIALNFSWEVCFSVSPVSLISIYLIRLMESEE